MVMSARRRFLSLALYAGGVFSLPTQAASPRMASPGAILFEFGTPASEPLEVWTGRDTLPARIEKSLEFGDDPHGGVLRLLPAEAASDRHRVSVQFETSAAISGEGPHIDLLDWKHCRSDWRVARPVDQGGFRLPTPQDRDRTCFPRATREELRHAVRKELAKYDMGAEWNQRWLGLARQSPRVGEFPSYIEISTVRVRIEQYDGRQWRVLTTIDFRVPMGC